ncbi:MAG: hypothetical protein ACM3II_18520 [Rhodospirillaceae bacterium]
MRRRHVVQAISSRFEPVSLFLVIALSLAVIVADANRRLSPELRLDTFEDQAAALWSVDQPLPGLPSPRLLARALPARPHLP